MDVVVDGRLDADPDPRERVFTAILEDGPVSAAGLAERFGVTPAAIRRHLDALESDGLIESLGARASGRRGRPAREFVVSAKGQRAARGQYDELATAALAFVAEQLGPAAVADFAERHLAGLAAHWAERLAAAAAPEVGHERVTAFAEALTVDGYAATARPVGVRRRRTRGGLRTQGVPVDGTQLCQGHCPVGAVAARYPQLCEAETRAFSRLLGVHVQRLSTIAGGAHVCTTFVPEARPGEGQPGQRAPEPSQPDERDKPDESEPEDPVRRGPAQHDPIAPSHELLAEGVTR